MIDKDKLTAALDFLEGATDALALELANERTQGLACAVGTTQSRLKSLRVTAIALEKRDANRTDRSDIAFTLNTLKWLETADWVLKDVTPLTLQIKERQYTYREVIKAFAEMLEAALVPSIDSQGVAA